MLLTRDACAFGAGEQAPPLLCTADVHFLDGERLWGVEVGEDYDVAALRDAIFARAAERDYIFERSTDRSKYKDQAKLVTCGIVLGAAAGDGTLIRDLKLPNYFRFSGRGRPVIFVWYRDESQAANLVL